MITHRVVGEIAFRRWGQLGPDALGPFLLGNVLVDLHMFELAERLDTHFAERHARDGRLAFDKSCQTMLANLDSLLARPWDALSRDERAFVAGYLCHLAADEEFKRFDLESMDRLGYQWWRALPYPASVVMTVFNVECQALSPDLEAAATALAAAQVPEVFTHVDHSALLTIWEIARPHALEGGTVQSWLDLFARAGFSEEDVARQRRHHAEHWDEAHAFTREFFGGVEVRVEAMVARTLGVLPQLWKD